MNDHDKDVLKATIATTLALSLSGCGKMDYVKCEGVAKAGAKKNYVVMDKGLCTKLAGGVVKPLAAADAAKIKASDDYVKCYGVAAAGKNDCGTSSTACAGSVSTPREPGAWVAALKGVCEQVGGHVGTIKRKT